MDSCGLSSTGLSDNIDVSSIAYDILLAINDDIDKMI